MPHHRVTPNLRTWKWRWQDRRTVRRYRHRWIVERTNAWLQNFRCLVVRCDRRLEFHRAFVHIACLLIAPRRL